MDIKLMHLSRKILAKCNKRNAIKLFCYIFGKIKITLNFKHEIIQFDMWQLLFYIFERN